MGGGGGGGGGVGLPHEKVGEPLFTALYFFVGSEAREQRIARDLDASARRRYALVVSGVRDLRVEKKRRL